MMIGAHPDDEDSALLAYLARGENARTAYLSLTRGDGGQNLIGDELFESLGVIRTEELLQARRLDGAEQYFTRAFDYGFSKTLDEAKAKMGRKNNFVRCGQSDQKISSAGCHLAFFGNSGGRSRTTPICRLHFAFSRQSRRRCKSMQRFGTNLASRQILCRTRLSCDK